MDESPEISRKVPRRALLAAIPVAATLAAAGFWYRGPGETGPALSPPEALAATEAGRLLIIDIRRPDEWARTGVAAPAREIDMRRDDFTEMLGRLRGEAGAEVPIALICARGVRSRRLQRRLTEAGIGNLYDIPEGMEGSRAGPGWVARGLPVRVYSG